ncbi:positive regulation of extrinsic apoptotic signaling pathway via death domain receptors protein [Branchiostoma belcheri]|nr:positive regulation of extrinsic apoptotic signaling pathway via death domain receptors protein [Branchiostoma belcheri]
MSNPTEELEKKLYGAAGKGHVETVTELIQQGVDVNFVNMSQFKQSPLHHAAEEGHVGVAELLLKAWAQVDSRDQDENTPLHKAASGGHVGVAELLLKAGAQVDSRDEDENTPLHYAASKGHVGVAELLLKAGAQVDSRNGFEYTPLHYAALRGHVGVAELLLKAGAQVNSRDQDEDMPLHNAASEGHVGVADLLLKSGAQVDSKNKLGRTPEDIAASTDVKSWPYGKDSDRVLAGRKGSLSFLQRKSWPDRAFLSMAGPGGGGGRTVGPEGGELQATSCTVTVPGGAVTMETEITCQVIDPNDVTLPLKDGEMLVSDIIELGPHGTTFHQPVTVQMQCNNTSLGGTTEVNAWVSEDRSQWAKIKTINASEDRLAVSVDHFSIFAIVSQPKKENFNVSTEGFKLTSSTQPAVQISFPEQAVTSPTEVSIQVQEIKKETLEDLKAQDQSFRGVLSTSPIVKVVTTPENVTISPHEEPRSSGPTKLRVMSCEEGAEHWEDVTDDTIKQDTEEFVEFEVTHFTRWIVILVKDSYVDPEELGPILLKFCRWLQSRPVQFILLQREDNANELVAECTLGGSAEERRCKLMKEGYKAPLPSATVNLFEGQQVEIHIGGNVAPYDMESSRKQQITFHSQNYNCLHMQVMALKDATQKGLDGQGYAEFYALPRVEVERQKVKRKILPLKLSALEEVAKGQAEPKSTFLCRLPIRVPYDSPEETSGGAVCADLQGVEKYFYFTKEEVSTDWMDLAFYLGLKDADISNIAGRNRDDKSCCMDMLQEWKKKKGDAATIEVLMEALSEAGLQSVVDGLKRKFPDIGKFH